MSMLRVNFGAAKRTSGIDVMECYRQMAEYPDRISEGPMIAGLPFHARRRFTLAINLQTADRR